MGTSLSPSWQIFFGFSELVIIALIPIIVVWMQKRDNVNNLKAQLFRTLITEGARAVITKEHVACLNEIIIVFHNNWVIRAEWNKFMEITAEGSNDNGKSKLTDDAYDKLRLVHATILEEMAKEIGLKTITKEQIQRLYNPEALRQYDLAAYETVLLSRDFYKKMNEGKL